MEYRKVGDSAWTSGTGSDVTGLSSGRYQIRFKETDNYNAGEVVEVQVPESGLLLHLGSCCLKPIACTPIYREAE